MKRYRSRSPSILAAERMGRLVEPLIPGFVRRKATARAREWFMAGLNDYDVLGAIFTAMVNAYEAMSFLGIPPDDERWRITRESIERLLVIREDIAYCHPCVSPVWDTGLATLTLQDVDRHERNPQTLRALESSLRWHEKSSQLKSALSPSVACTCVWFGLTASNAVDY